MTFRTALLVVAVVVLAVSLGGYGLWLLVQPPDDIGWCAEGIQVAHVTYQSNQAGYLNFSWGPTPLWCVSARMAPGSSMSLWLFLHNMDTAHSHSIRGIDMLSGFTVVATSTSIPATVVAGGNLTFDVTFDVPNSPGEYSPSADLTES